MLRRIALSLLASLLAICAGAQELSVNDSGTWRKLTHVYVNDSGTWRDIQEVYVNDSGTWRSVFVLEVTTTITVTVGHFDTGLPPPDDGTEDGYDSGLIVAAMGSRSPTGYTDGGANSRTITLLASDSSSGGGATVYFALSGTSIANTDTTFKRIVINGVTYSRSSASYTASFSGSTLWIWTVSGAGFFPTSGTQAIDIVI